MKIRLELELDVPDFLVEASGGDPVEHVVWEHIIQAAQLRHLERMMKCIVEKHKAEEMDLTVVGSDMWAAMANGHDHWAKVLSGPFDENLKITVI